MPKRPDYQRPPADIKRGCIARWPADKPPPEVIAQRVRYRANGKHKSYPSRQGFWNLVRADAAKCPTFSEDQWHKLEDVLRRAILSGFVGEDFRGDFPSRVWAYINGKLYEARYGGANGEYHGFPIESPQGFPRDQDGLLERIPSVEIPVH